MNETPGILRNSESGELVHQSCVEVEELSSYDHVEAATVTGGSCGICDEPLRDEEEGIVIEDEESEE